MLVRTENVRGRGTRPRPWPKWNEAKCSRRYEEIVDKPKRSLLLYNSDEIDSTTIRPWNGIHSQTSCLYRGMFLQTTPSNETQCVIIMISAWFRINANMSSSGRLWVDDDEINTRYSTFIHIKIDCYNEFIIIEFFNNLKISNFKVYSIFIQTSCSQVLGLSAPRGHATHTPV